MCSVPSHIYSNTLKYLEYLLTSSYSYMINMPKLFISYSRRQTEVMPAAAILLGQHFVCHFTHWDNFGPPRSTNLQPTLNSPSYSWQGCYKKRPWPTWVCARPIFTGLFTVLLCQCCFALWPKINAGPTVCYMQCYLMHYNTSSQQRCYEQPYVT